MTNRRDVARGGGVGPASGDDGQIATCHGKPLSEDVCLYCTDVDGGALSCLQWS